MKSLIQSVEVSYFVHATEDGARVGRAVASLLGLETEPTSEVAEGHFGNPILLAKVHLTGEEAESAVKAVFSKMTADAKETLKRGLAEHIDEHSALYLRLDKQKLLAGQVALSDSDPVRVRVKPRLYAVRGSSAQLYRGLLG